MRIADFLCLGLIALLLSLEHFVVWPAFLRRSTAVVLVFDSLLPAMALHTLIDVIQGILGWLVFREPRAEVETR